MRSRALLVLVAACGGTGGAGPLRNASTSRPSPPVASDAPADCTARIEDSPPGNHDRFSFVDPTTQLHGFKTGSGAVAIAARFRFAYEFGRGGVAAAVDDAKRFVFIDTHGRVIARALPFDNGPDYFQEGVARIIDDRSKIGFVTDHGEIVVPPTYDRAGAFCHDRAEVAVDGTKYVIDRRGRRVAP